ncbi:ATP-grasp domain-containing protein [Synechococcus sp. MVIR-18-1]|uniref:ATP-grasp domain-containing protein n=1 Tax=Synechococcus sp. MVIR-18-1 TaxID=1386941 RepID=UPI001648FAC1|nr:ATP-grasp domain-containing protein [Synechococcus sp. MVIR-18-1]QNI75217.1 carbamoyl-phosphate synthase L chain/ ATP binding domain protein [Synechococcus sp. MVIR-18-1]
MTNVLITAMGGGGHGEQILKALMLSRNHYRIIGADANADCPQFKLVDKSEVLPLASSPDYIENLFRLIERYQIKALFHGCEPELKLFAKFREKIESFGVFLPINPTSVIDLCMDKEKTNKKLSELGFESPKFTIISNKDDFANIDWYPVVVKPSVGGGGSANVYIAQDRSELYGLAEYLNLGEQKTKFFVQEYVGTPDNEFTVGVLHDMDGNYINSIAVKRALTGQLNIRMSVNNHTDKHELGSKLVISSGVSQGKIGRYPEVTSQCSAIAKSIGARGPVNIQCRLVDGIVKVFEINPRFSGTTSLRAMVGYNEPDILIQKHIYGADIKTNFSYEEGNIIRSLVETRLS